MVRPALPVEIEWTPGPVAVGMYAKIVVKVKPGREGDVNGDVEVRLESGLRFWIAGQVTLVHCVIKSRYIVLQIRIESLVAPSHLRLAGSCE